VTRHWHARTEFIQVTDRTSHTQNNKYHGRRPVIHRRERVKKREREREKEKERGSRSVDSEA
jgi:hypothetical protein